MQVTIFVEVKHLKHKVRFDHVSRIKERSVKLLDKVVKVYSFMLLAIGQHVVKPCIKERGLVSKVPPQVGKYRVFGQVALVIFLLVKVVLKEGKEPE